jgi:hypothetical protein
MRTFIQLKDNVGFAAVNTSGETEGIEVENSLNDIVLIRSTSLEFLRLNAKLRSVFFYYSLSSIVEPDRR